ncbi:MAG: nucleotide-binding protein [Deltaproteobacteria bacterium]|nr:nucleotide-binding protein [Deltaproteobacteria bacterium]
MAKKRIFLACSSERKKTAETIAQRLQTAGYDPWRWWTDFRPGSITIERLQEIPSEVDGAVFLFARDDETWYRHQIVGSARDNVVLEFGLFLAHLGRERAIIVKSADVHLPTDVLGVNSQLLLGRTANLAARIVEHFDVVFSRTRAFARDEIPWAADPQVVEKQILDPLPPDWHERALYFGTEGAKAWLHYLQEPRYSKRLRGDERAVQLVSNAVQPLDVRTLVSLGPGDAEWDLLLARMLRGREPWLQYIPVDISDGLLQKATALLGDRAEFPSKHRPDSTPQQYSAVRCLTRGEGCCRVFGLAHTRFSVREEPALFLRQWFGAPHGALGRQDPRELYKEDSSRESGWRQCDSRNRGATYRGPPDSSSPRYHEVLQMERPAVLDR